MPEQTGGYQGGAAQPQGGGPVQQQNWSPPQMEQLLQLLLQQNQTGSAGIDNLNANPGANPLFQGQVNPVMAVLSRLFGQQAQTLTDQQRANGNLGDTSSGIAQGQLMGEQATSAGGTFAGMMNQSYQNALAGYQAPSNMTSNAVRSMPQYQQSYMRPQDQGNTNNNTNSNSNGFGGPGFWSENDPYFAAALARSQGTPQQQLPQQQSNIQQAPPAATPPTIQSVLGSSGGGPVGLDPNTGWYTNQNNQAYYDSSGFFNNNNYMTPQQQQQQRGNGQTDLSAYNQPGQYGNPGGGGGLGNPSYEEWSGDYETDWQGTGAGWNGPVW